MKKGLKGLFTASLAVVALGGLVACGGNEEPTPTPTDTPTVEKPTEQGYVEKDFKFEGKNKIGILKRDAEGNMIMGPQGPAQDMVDFDCVLNGTVADHKFELKLDGANGLKKSFKGTYEFFNGVGYTFTFAGSNEVVRTTFDAKTKTHTLVYTAKLGRDGSGEIKLTCADDQFEISEEKQFITAAHFAGQFFSKDGIIINNPDKPEKGVGFGLQLFANGVAEFKNNHIKELNQEGTFTYENDVFTLNIKDADGTTAITAKSTKKDGIYSIPLTLHYKNQELNINMEWNSNYYGGHGLSGIAYPMGAEFKVVLTLGADNKAIFDGFSVNPLKAALAGMNINKMFDRVGTYTYDEAANVYTFKVMDTVVGPNGQPVMGEDGKPEMVERVFKSTYDEAKKEYSLHYVVGAAEFDLKGTDFGASK